MKKVVSVAILWCSFIFTVFFNEPAYALPAQDVRLINNRDYFKVVNKLIEEADNSISVIMFSVYFYQKHPSSYSNLLIRSLIEAKKRGVEVGVILEKDFSEKDSIRIREVAQMLVDSGVKVFWDQDEITTHCKLLIIDSNITVIGSMNWSYSALAKNNEASVVIESEAVAKAYKKYFEGVKVKEFIK